MPAPTEPDAYLLGTAIPELRRLQLQDELWRESTESLWDRADFRSGQQLLELGCGPGFSSLALARRVGTEGKVFAWDRSAAFLQHLESRAEQQGLTWIQTHQADISADLDPSLAGMFDGVFSRWLLCWMERPEIAIRVAFRALRPGGKLVLFDYFHYHSIDLLPHDPAFRRGIDAVEAAWCASGGNPNLGEVLPQLVRDHGFRILDQRLCKRSATPKDPLWQWPTTFFPAFMAQLVTDGFLDSTEAEAFLAAFRHSEQHPQGLFHAPPMIELVAEKT